MSLLIFALNYIFFCSVICYGIRLFYIIKQARFIIRSFLTLLTVTLEESIIESLMYFHRIVGIYIHFTTITSKYFIMNLHSGPYVIIQIVTITFTICVIVSFLSSSSASRSTLVFFCFSTVAIPVTISVWPASTFCGTDI